MKEVYKQAKNVMSLALLLGGLGTMALSQSIPLKDEDCSYWKSVIIAGPNMGSTKDEDPLKRPDILKGMECLLSFKGDKRLSTVPSVTRMTSSGTFGFVPADVAALYYISYLYLERWDHSKNGAIALFGEKSERNDPEVVEKAYAAYERWFKTVKKVGLKQARKENLDPLGGSGVRWF